MISAARLAHLHEVAQVHHVSGHRWSSRFWVGVSNQTLTEHRR